MKRIILIPILLSTFLLVGCESELDRCIEANVVTELNEEKYFSENESYCSSYESHRKKTAEIAAEFEEIRLSSFRWRPGEESAEEWQQRIKEIEDKYYEDRKKEWTEFRNSCHPELREIFYSEKERRIRESEAERFCNSQGIY